MAVTVFLEINIKPESVNDLMSFLRDDLQHTRGFDGCNSVTVQQNQEDPSNTVLVENWDSKEQFEKYFGWRTERGDIEKLGAWLAGPPSIRYFDNAGV
jgi:quinol monooxygenase YgiN